MDRKILALQEKMYSEHNGEPLTFMRRPIGRALQRHDEFEGHLALTGFRIMRDLSIKYNKGDQACEEGRQAVNAGDWGKFAATISSFASSLSCSEDMRTISLLLISELMLKYTRIFEKLRCTCSSGIEFATRMYEAEKESVYTVTTARYINVLLGSLNKSPQQV